MDVNDGTNIDRQVAALLIAVALGTTFKSARSGYANRGDCLWNS
jgi:hypothetical protein